MVASDKIHMNVSLTDHAVPDFNDVKIFTSQPLKECKHSSSILGAQDTPMLAHQAMFGRQQKRNWVIPWVNIIAKNRHDKHVATANQALSDCHLTGTVGHFWNLTETVTSTLH